MTLPKDTCIFFEASIEDLLEGTTEHLKKNLQWSRQSVLHYCHITDYHARKGILDDILRVPEDLEVLKVCFQLSGMAQSSETLSSVS